MTSEKLGALLEAFAEYYWSVPVRFVKDKIAEWHPEVSVGQLERVLKRLNENIFWHHCCVETDGLEEPELVAEHLVAVDEDDLPRFIATRTNNPYCECDEDALLRADAPRFELPEVKAIVDFGKTELGLDDEWTEQLVIECAFCQQTSLCEGTSWVMDFLKQERFGKIHFRTIEQVKRFRELGNRFYQAMPNPVFRGWKPTEIENPPALLDDIPEKDEDIPDEHSLREELFAQYGGREEMARQFSELLPKQKIGRNDPCPCGSGKKYKKCCGR